jgi:hypothetical protein
MPLYKMSRIQNDSIVSIKAHNQFKSEQELLKEERRWHWREGQKYNIGDWKANE